MYCEMITCLGTIGTDFWSGRTKSMNWNLVSCLGGHTSGEGYVSLPILKQQIQMAFVVAGTMTGLAQRLHLPDKNKHWKKQGYYPCKEFDFKNGSWIHNLYPNVNVFCGDTVIIKSMQIILIGGWVFSTHFGLKLWLHGLQSPIPKHRRCVLPLYLHCFHFFPGMVTPTSPQFISLSKQSSLPGCW